MRRSSEGWWRGVVLLAGLLMLTPLPGRAIAMTKVQDTVYRADGAIAQGTLLVSWSAFTAADGSTVSAGSTTATLANDGSVTLQLAPTQGAQPAGSYYTVVYHLSDGTTEKEYWVVPTISPVTIAMMRTKVVPAALAQQGLNQQYVTAAVNTALSTYLPLKGGALSGSLNLAADPVSGMQAATKQYVDAHASTLPSGIVFGNGTPTARASTASDVVGLFHSTSGAALTYLMKTAFNEGAAGATLNGTAPATTVNGSKWAFSAAGTTWNYQAGGDVIAPTPSASSTDGPVVDIGTSDNYNLRVNFSQPTGQYTMIMLRYSDTINMIFANIDSGTLQIYKYIAGTYTLLGDYGNVDSSNLLFAVSGTTITVSDGTHAAVAYTVPAPTATQTKVGFTLQSGTNAVMHSFSADTGLLAANLPCVGFPHSDGTCTALAKQHDLVANNGSGKPTDLPEIGVATDASGNTTVAWQEDYSKGYFDARNTKYGNGGIFGPAPAQALQDVATAMICYAGMTGKHPSIWFPPGTFPVGTATHPTLYFPVGGNYYGAPSVNGNGTIFQATYNNRIAVQWTTGLSAVCSDGASHSSNISAGNVIGIGEHGCGQGGCINVPGDTGNYPNGGPNQGGIVVGDSQGFVSQVAASNNGSNGVEISGLDSRAQHIWGYNNMEWYMFGRHSIEVPAPGAITVTPSAAGGTLAAATYYYKATSVTAIGESMGSAEVSATTTGTTGSVALSWAAVSGATKYRIYRSTAAGAESGYYEITTNSFTDIGAATTAGSMPPYNTTAYQPSTDPFHGNVLLDGLDGQYDFIETYGTFNTPGSEYGRIGGVVWLGGGSSLSHVFSQIDEIGIIRGYGQGSGHLNGFRIEGCRGECYLTNNGQDNVSDGTITSACRQQGLRISTGQTASHCDYLDDQGGSNSYSNVLVHNDSFFGTDYSTGQIFPFATSNYSQVTGTFETPTNYYAGQGYTQYRVQGDGGATICCGVTGATPNVGGRNGIFFADTAANSSTGVSGAVIGQEFNVVGNNAYVTLKSPANGGHWHNCNGGDLNLNLGGAVLHYVAESGTIYGSPAELYEECDPAKNLTIRPVPATSSDACMDADFTFGAGPASTGGFGIYRCHPANTWTFYPLTAVSF